MYNGKNLENERLIRMYQRNILRRTGLCLTWKRSFEAGKPSDDYFIKPDLPHELKGTIQSRDKYLWKDWYSLKQMVFVWRYSGWVWWEWRWGEDAGCWRCSMLDADAGCWMLDAGCLMLDAGSWYPKSASRPQTPESSIRIQTASSIQNKNYYF